jgi:hypothetical protein
MIPLLGKIGGSLLLVLLIAWSLLFFVLTLHYSRLSYQSDRDWVGVCKDFLVALLLLAFGYGCTLLLLKLIAL